MGGRVSFLTPQGNLGKLVGNLAFTVTEWRRIVLCYSEPRASNADFVQRRRAISSKGEVATAPSVDKHCMTSRVVLVPVSL